jgi:hypothetical protein
VPEDGDGASPRNVVFKRINAAVRARKLYLAISNSAWKGLKTTEYKRGFNWFVSVVKVPLSVEEMRAPSVGINWLKYLENKRIQLLQLVSVEHFRVTQSYEKSDCALQVELFPLHDVLEHRYCKPDRWGSEVVRKGQKGLVLQICCNFITLWFRVCLFVCLFVLV